MLVFKIELTADQLFQFGCVVLISLTVIRLAYQSCRTLLTTRELFQPVCLQHDDLVRELRGRQEQGIE